MKSLFFILILLACLEKDAAGQAKPLTPPAPPPGKVAEKKDSASQVINISDNHATININPPSQNQNGAAQKQTPTAAAGGLQVIEFRNDHGNTYLNAPSLPFEQPFLLSGNAKIDSKPPLVAITVNIESHIPHENMDGDDDCCFFSFFDLAKDIYRLFYSTATNKVSYSAIWLRSSDTDTTSSFLIPITPGLSEADHQYSVTVEYWRRPDSIEKLKLRSKLDTVLNSHSRNVKVDLDSTFATAGKIEPNSVKYLMLLPESKDTLLSDVSAHDLSKDMDEIDYTEEQSDSIDTVITQESTDQLSADSALKVKPQIEKFLKTNQTQNFTVEDFKNAVNRSSFKNLITLQQKTVETLHAIFTKNSEIAKKITDSLVLIRGDSTSLTTSITDDQLKTLQLNLVFGMGWAMGIHNSPFPFPFIGAQIYIWGVRNWAFPQQSWGSKFSFLLGTAINTKPTVGNIQLQSPFGGITPMIGFNWAWTARISFGADILIFQVPTNNPFIQSSGLNLLTTYGFNAMVDFDIFKDILSLGK